MKNLAFISALLLASPLSAQSFEWDKKGADAGAAVISTRNEVRGTALADYDAAYKTRQVGLAAAYAPDMDGRTTAYGERYQPGQLTASHAILPLGSLVKVVDLNTQKSVVVRINDTAQKCEGCLITLSTAAADSLGLNLRGRVSVERTGFSNWNPNVVAKAAPRPNVYGTGTPIGTAADADAPTFGSADRNVGYDLASKEVQPTLPIVSDVPAGPTVYNRSALPPNATVRPSVLAREVVNTPKRSAAEDTWQPEVSGRIAPDVYESPALASPQVVYYQPVQNTANQVAPPRPTVPRFQENRSASVPAYYPVPATAKSTKAAKSILLANSTVVTGVSPAKELVGAAVVHSVQLAAYANEGYAKQRVTEFKGMGVEDVFYRSSARPDGSLLHRVYSGSYSSKSEAQTAATYLRDVLQIEGMITQVK
ncbi:RlpA-like double-psi beta-barrel domain-containing protein [Neolewinella antarctica]|uniref:Rare lipoprotein A (Peptidoglycan hydrolase) n=1 Tax=Neolewinella antarctica TaxID=442734 RepID=A0ABX0X881_9BACT|nr:RlpA-like double-psi beta-barrel domain-containing protein [Neolewinella antarctica]NJC25184.1 rare lipoprotein A (peptidoglycan hydrolase) [Neolewinella antarctica]